jgi:hypothetical protein
MILGSVFSSSFIPINSFADMPGDSMDGGGSGGGNGDNQDNSGDEEDNDMPDSKEAPATTGALTAGRDSDDDDDNDNDSGGNRDNDNENNNDNEPTSEDAPVNTDTTTTNKNECPKGQEVTLFSKLCRPLPNRPTTTYELPQSVLPYKGNEVELIESYDIRGAKVTSPEGTKLGFFTFKDGTIIEVTVESDSNDPSKLIRHEKITPGSNTPLDRLGVVQVDLPSTGSTLTVPPNSKPGTGDTFLHKITYNDGSAITASQTGEWRGFGHGYDPNNQNGDKGFWDVYGPNNQLKSTTMADPATRITSVENKQDNSVTFHPQGANPYTVYPRAADGTQKTVTVTSEGQPIVTVRDANNNIIPPKE